MCYEIVVSEGNSTNNLFEKEASVLLGDFIILYIIIELSSLRKFHDDKDIFSGVKYFIEFDNVLVVDEFEYFDLSFDLNRGMVTLEIMFLFFIRRLFIIFTATRTPVMSCLASILDSLYI